jgi:hypothetical protein
LLVDFGSLGYRNSAPRRLGHGRFQVPFLFFAICPCFAGIEFYEKVARRNLAAVLDPGNGDDLAGVERLHDFGAPARLNAPLRDRIDFEPAEIGPGKRASKNEADDPDRDDADGRGGRLVKFQRCGQEFAVNVVHTHRGHGRSSGCPSCPDAPDCDGDQTKDKSRHPNAYQRFSR